MTTARCKPTWIRVQALRCKQWLWRRPQIGPTSCPVDGPHLPPRYSPPSPNLTKHNDGAGWSETGQGGEALSDAEDVSTGGSGSKGFPADLTPASLQRRQLCQGQEWQGRPWTAGSTGLHQLEQGLRCMRQPGRGCGVPRRSDSPLSQLWGSNPQEQGRVSYTHLTLPPTLRLAIDPSHGYSPQKITTDEHL